MAQLALLSLIALSAAALALGRSDVHNCFRSGCFTRTQDCVESRVRGRGVCVNHCYGSFVNCFVDPCESAKCPNHPEAICQPNYCDGCFADFYGNDGRILSKRECEGPRRVARSAEEENRCPPGVTPIACFVDPCETLSCPNHPNAVCKANYCGGCFAEFYEYGRRVDATCGSRVQEPPQANKCPPGVSEVLCFVDPCETHTCPNHPNAVCKRNTCGGCFAEFYVNGRRVDDTCGSTVQEPPQSHEESEEFPLNCPPEEQVKCFVNPCKFARCQRHPEATCEPNYCGGCHAVFYNGNGRVRDCNEPNPF